MRNDIVHANGECSVHGSALFLMSYRESLSSIRQQGVYATLDSKGKRPMMMKAGQHKAEEMKRADQSSMSGQWEPPPDDWVKINSDAAFQVESGKASAGVIIRNARGEVLLTAWRMLRKCGSALEAEADACLFGVRLAVEWTHQPAIVEADCWEMIQAMQQADVIRAAWRGLIGDIRGAGLLLPECKFSRVKRGCNAAAHALAHLGFRELREEVWHLRCPTSLMDLVNRERVSCQGRASSPCMISSE